MSGASTPGGSTNARTRGAPSGDAAAETTLEGFLLTRAARDTPRGIELSFWVATARGPAELLVGAQEAVCFVERERELALPARARRRERPLRLLGGGPVDALYCRDRRALASLRACGVPLAESDVPVADRYLMERFVRAGVRARGRLEHDGGVLRLADAVLRPADCLVALGVVSLDIEIRAGSDTLYSIAGARLVADGEAAGGPSSRTPDAVVFLVGGGGTERRDGYTLVRHASERAALEGFFDWLAAVDPDVLSGWSILGFDLPFLERKCRALGIPLRLGRGGRPARARASAEAGAGRAADVPGRAVLDGIDLLKASFRHFESYALEHVARELLGVGKRIGPSQDRVAEIDRLYRDDPRALADYNVRDCTLVNDILARAELVAFAARRASLTGLPLERLVGAAAAFDHLYLPRLHRAGYVAPDVRERANASGGPGGHVLDSVPGFHRDVLVLDFKSLYPSIIRTFLVDPLGLELAAGDPQAVPGFDGARFAREGHILPGLIETLWTARERAKADGDTPLAQAIKIIMNSFYGIFGTTRCRFYSEALVASITRRGHEIIETTRQRVEAGGHRVIYGDTDSLFVRLAGAEDAGGERRAAGDALVAELNDYWRRRLKAEHGLDSALELEYETHFARLFMPSLRGSETGSKKRYAGLIGSAGEEPRLVVKGLEAVRTDWTPLARDAQRELLRRVLLDLPWEDWLRRTVERLRAGELDDALVYTRRLRRGVVDAGERAPAHVVAARRLAAPGRTIRYVMTLAGPEPLEALSSPPDHEHYVERQLAPALDGVLHALGTSTERLVGAQLSMF